MTQPGVDVAVIGAGIMGSAAAWQLSKRGHRVFLFEQFDLGHVRGSSHGATRIFRLAYDDVDYVRLAQHALPLWREAERELEKELLWNTGGLDLGPPELIEPVAAALTAAGAPFERLTAGDLRRRYPAYAIAADWMAVHQPDAGVLRADECRLGLVELAQRSGANVRTKTQVTRIQPANNEVLLETTAGAWRGDAVVVAAAGWSPRLLAPLGLQVPLKVTREQVAYFRLNEDTPFLPFIWHAAAHSFEFYGLPNAAKDEIKVAEHGTGPEVDPDSEGDVDPTRFEALRQFVREHLPVAESSPHRAEACLYASTPDDDFVIERSGKVIFGVGFGGHGFKFGAGIGAILADLVDEQPGFPIERFSAARFHPSYA